MQRTPLQLVKKLKTLCGAIVFANLSNCRVISSWVTTPTSTHFQLTVCWHKLLQKLSWMWPRPVAGVGGSNHTGGYQFFVPALIWFWRTTCELFTVKIRPESSIFSQSSSHHNECFSSYVNLSRSTSFTEQLHPRTLALKKLSFSRISHQALL